MNAIESTQGLNCPNCGGMVPVPEGQMIVACPYCQLCSLVRGERGILRYQATPRVDRAAAENAFRKFLTGTWAIAPAAARQAQLSEVFMVHLPYWTVWARAAGWVFGEKRVGSGDHKRYEPREVRILQDLSWNNAACDVGEFGVGRVPLADRDLQPFNPEQLHNTGMVFEPVGSFNNAIKAAEEQFEKTVEKQAGLDRVSQRFVSLLRRRSALVYPPLWVLRYLFRGRSFQVVVDAVSGRVLYGKAPGNTLYRAAVLVFGMAVGAIVAVDAPMGIIVSSDDGDVLMFALVLLVVGLGVMFAAYRTYRKGEHYEYRQDGPGDALGGINLSEVVEMVTSSKDLSKWIDRLN
ncbi:MAG: hypothetical protein ACKOC5_02635 [Chloroflexota bacterium]